MWIIAVIFSTSRNKHLELYYNNSNIVWIGNIFGQSIVFFNFKLIVKLLLWCL